MSLLDELAGGEIAPDAYDKLPESIKATITRGSWMWLSDKEKADLVRTECEPEYFDN